MTCGAEICTPGQTIPFTLRYRDASDFSGVSSFARGLYDSGDVQSAAQKVHEYWFGGDALVRIGRPTTATVVYIGQYSGGGGGTGASSTTNDRNRSGGGGGAAGPSQNGGNGGNASSNSYGSAGTAGAGRDPGGDGGAGVGYQNYTNDAANDYQYLNVNNNYFTAERQSNNDEKEYYVQSTSGLFKDYAFKEDQNHQYKNFVVVLNHVF